jgi:PPP family 3-phenylpropionic acid transporter
MKKIWPFSFYFLYFAAFSSLMPFLVLLYQELNFTGAQIGLLTGLPQLIILFAAPFWTNVADRRHLHRLVMSLGIGISIAAIITLKSMTLFSAVFLIILIFNFFLAPVSPLIDSATISMLGEDKGIYGRIRMGGTIGWGLIAPIAGALVDHYGLKISFWGYSVFMLINLFVVQNIVHESTSYTQSSNIGIRYFFTNRRWLIFLFSAFLGGLGSLTVTSYLFPYMAEMGSTKYMMGIATLIATITEFPVFFLANRLVKRFTPQGLFVLSLVFVGIRSFVFAWVTTPTAVLVVQAFGGMIFPAMWSAGVAYADEQAPAGLKSTAQGLFGAISFGFGSAVGGLIGGMLLESVGGRGMFFVFGIIILGGLAVVETIKRILPREEIPFVTHE